MLRSMAIWTMGLAVLAGTLHAQQWERLPLNIGFVDKIVQNPYYPTELVGYVRTGDFYRSHDAGLSWRRIQQDVVPFKRDFLSLTFDSRNRLYLIVAFEGLYRSSDGGISWDSLLVPGPGYFGGFSKTTVIDDGTIYVWMSSTGTLLRSRDDGSAWEEIGPPDPRQDWDMYIDRRGGRLIIMFEYERAIVSTDGGITWTPYPLPAPARSKLFSHERSGLLSLEYSAGGENSEMYESKDTGRTWQQKTRQTIHVRQGDCTRTIRGEKYFRINDSVVIIHLCNTLQRSTDSGRTYTQTTNYRIEDAVCVGTELIASVPLRGVIRSTDLGVSWEAVPSPPEMLRSDFFELAHAHDDTMFVMIKGQEIPGKLVTKLMESDDKGMTWKLLFSTVNSTPSMLGADAGRPARYYIRSRKSGDLHMILSGVAGQTVPDTVLVTTSVSRPTEIYPPETFHCTPSVRFPGWIYASRNTNSIGWSSDRGETWEWRALPISISSVQPCPTQRDPQRIIVSAFESNPIPAFDYSGLYLIENAGPSFEWINRSDELGGPLYTTRDDRIFRYWPKDSSSTDLGRTWELMRAGLETKTSSMEHFQSHGSTLTATNTGIYLFDDDHWEILRDSQGNSIWDEHIQTSLTGQIADLDYTGEHVYISIPCRGLYRTSTKIVTGVRSVVFPVASTPRLDVFPNPGDTEMTIRWEGFDQDGGVTVEIFDVLGRAVKRIETASTAGVVHWDCTGATGASVMPGLYFARLTDGVNVATENVLIIR
jgi:photosystem II stability/assembly factor-like uncharacterized protein